MDFVDIPLNKATRLLNHGPMILVSSTDGQTANACAVAWCAPASRDPARFVMILGKRHKTYQDLMVTGDCVLNLPTADALEQVMVCGKKSGHDGDKLGPAGIELLPSQKVLSPRLACCSAWIEARLWAEPKWDEAGPSLLVVEAVAASCRPGLMSEDHFVDVDNFPTLHHLGSNRFALPGKIIQA